VLSELIQLLRHSEKRMNIAGATVLGKILHFLTE